MRPILLLLVSSVIFFGACRRDCTVPTFRINLNGFDSAETANGLVNKYEKNGQFTAPITSSSLNPSGHGIDPSFDYIVTLPNAAAEYRISEITVIHMRTEPYIGSSENRECADGATYRLNGVETRAEVYLETANWLSAKAFIKIDK